MIGAIERYLFEEKLTLKELSDMTGIELEKLIKIINGESKLTAKRCEIISNATGISINELLNYKPNEFGGYTVPFYESLQMDEEGNKMLIDLFLMVQQYDILKRVVIEEE